MPHNAKLYKAKAAPTRDRAGQVTASNSHETTPKTIANCLFYGFTGGRQTSGREDFTQTVSFYCPAGTLIDEGDLIRNVRGLDFFETGPFIVENVRYVTTFGGKVHHISCKLRGFVG